MPVRSKSVDFATNPVTNFYELIPKKFQSEPRTYSNFDQIQIKIPFRAVITGATGSGKTNALLRLFTGINAFDKVYLYAKDLTEPIYMYWADAFEQAERTSGAQIFTKSNDLKTLPPVSSHDEKMNTLMVFDDMMTEKDKDLARATQYWIMGRKKNCSCVMLTQSYFKAPIDMRKNSELFFFTKLRTDRDLCFIMKDFELGLSEEQILKLFKEATKDGFPDFFLVDTETKDPRYRFRKNFEPMASAPIVNEPVKLIEDSKKRKKDENEDDESETEEIIPTNETDKQRVNRFAEPVSKQKKQKLSAAQLEDKVQAGHRDEMNKVLTVPKQSHPTIATKLAYIADCMQISIAELKAMGKSLGLTNKQLCVEMESAIKAGQFDHLIGV